MTRELQYPIRGERWDAVRDEYYYLQEHNGIRLGDIVQMESPRMEGELVTIVRLLRENEPERFVGVIRVPDYAGENAYATEYGDILGVSDYDVNTHGHMFDYITALYSGPCKRCISKCKEEERCAFYREEAE